MSNKTDENPQALRQLIIIGAGGHAVSVASVAISAGYKINCFVDKNKKGSDLIGYKVISDLTELANLNAYSFAIAAGDNAVREQLFNELTKTYGNLYFPPLIHNSATISSFSVIEDGAVVMPKAVVGPNSKVGKFCLINTQASIDHDCVMLDFASLAPGAITGGTVQIGLRSAISIGATIKHGLKIGDDSVIGANSYLDKDLPSNVVAYGTPAKIIRNRNTGDSYLK